MSKLFYIPLEEYDRRYTADWVKQFEAEFNQNNVNYDTIFGEVVSSKINCGDVLDAYGTNMYKFSQLIQIIQKIRDGEVNDGDVIFFADGWFPGVESLQYIRNISKKDFKLACIVHAGTWDPHDFTCRFGMRSWGKPLEESWFNFYDYVFVATQFHKDLIMSRLNISGDNIIVTGIPFYAEELAKKYPTNNKENIIIFPHRCNEEKHPELFDAVAERYPQFRFIKSIEICDTRDKYFSLLAKAKVMLSFADQETFGFSTVEAMALNNYVAVPDKLSYKETVPDEYRYSCVDSVCSEGDLEEVCRRIDYFIKNEDAILSTPVSKKYNTIFRYRDAIRNMLYEMGVV